MLARFKHTTTDGMKLDPDGIWTSYVAAAEELHRLERQLTLEKNRVEQYHSAFERDAVHIFKQKTEIEVLRDQLYQLYIEIERLRTIVSNAESQLKLYEKRLAESQRDWVDPDE